MVLGRILGCYRVVSSRISYRYGGIRIQRNYSSLRKRVDYLNVRTFCLESNFDLAKYEEVCNETLESLAEYFEEVLVENKYPESDVSLSSGVLTIFLNDKQGTYVINRQTPNRQIWLSSPVSGPKRYDWTGEKWIYKRDGISLHRLLEKEMSELLGKSVDLSNCSHNKEE
ncbi:frataxin, mitochondrial [Centruroides vittatus]|uniref:frataxin, mitochondrial n=1 Tax=Centruroides vittatus TaxID=120091 RepID=UPI00350F9A45